MPEAVSRQGLFARLRGGPVQLRPPWAQDERTFTDTCNNCGACFEACPSAIIVKGHAGYPIVDFSRGSCTFCGACVDVCVAGSFLPEARDAQARTSIPAWPVKAMVSDACVETKGVSCRMCEERCDNSAIRFRPKVGGGSTPAVSTADCTGCGSCVAACPVKAISIQQPSVIAEARA